MPSADSHCAIISPCGLITHWFLSPAPSVCLSCSPGSSLAGTPNHLMPGIFFLLPVFPYIPVAYSDSPSETQRTSRGKPRLLSAHDCQIYLVRPCDGYRTLSCVADSSRSPQASSACPLPFRVRGIPVRQPALLSKASFRRTLREHPCLRLSFGSVSLDMDFAEILCQYTSASPISSRTKPGTHRDRNAHH